MINYNLIYTLGCFPSSFLLMVLFEMHSGMLGYIKPTPAPAKVSVTLYQIITWDFSVLAFCVE